MTNTSGEAVGRYDVSRDQSDFTVSASDGTVRQTRGYQEGASSNSEDWTYLRQ